MLIMSRVCADFHDKSGALLFSVTPTTRLTFLEAPDTIRQDPLFDMLVNDGSLEVAETVAQRKRLENDPVSPVKAPEQPARKHAAKSSSTDKPADKP